MEKLTKLNDYSTLLPEFFLCFFSSYFGIVLKYFFQMNCIWCEFSMLFSSLILSLSVLARDQTKHINLKHSIFVGIFSFFTVYYLFFIDVLEILIIE
jgi:hypothetical protein